MIVEYYRPESLEEALELLGRKDPPTWPLGGGTLLNQPSKDTFAVVDLQNLGLDTSQITGSTIEFGAALPLARLIEQVQSGELKISDDLIKALKREGTHNLRQTATVAGALVGASCRSPFALAMLALDAQLVMQPGDDRISLGDLLPVRAKRLRGRLITQVTIPSKIEFAYEYVARSPADWHIVGVAMAVWPSGRTRLALGGYGDAPILAFDGSEAIGVETAAKSAYSQAGDQWATAEYRQEIASVLTKRCLKQLQISAQG
jgi:putative selenate reductase FAD-binding subunit